MRRSDRRLFVRFFVFFWRMWLSSILCVLLKLVYYFLLVIQMCPCALNAILVPYGPVWLYHRDVEVVVDGHRTLLSL